MNIRVLTATSAVSHLAKVSSPKVASQGLSANFLIDSAAISTEEIGNPPHRGR